MARVTDEGEQGMHRGVSVGHVITVVVTLVTVAVSYATTTTQTAEQVTAVKQDINEVKADVAIVASDVKELQDARYEDNARMVRVETLLNEILQEVRTR